MRIMVTGNLGFVGAETCRLLGDKHCIIGYDIMDGYDIRDLAQVDEFVQETMPDRILHLAAISRFLEADRNPLLCHQINVDGTRNIVEIAARYHIPLVYASTGSVLMPLDNYKAPFDESIPARGNSVYGCTKAIAECIVRQHMPHIVLRYAHLYGKEKRGHGLVWLFAQRIERGLQPVLYGGSQTGDFCYVKDVAAANLLALTASWDSWNAVYNIGSGVELTARDASEAVCKHLGYDGEIAVKALRPFDPGRFYLDISKARLALGYAPKFSFDAGLQDMASCE